MHKFFGSTILPAFSLLLELLQMVFAFLFDSMQISSTMFLLINNFNASGIEYKFFASFYKPG
jgi:hypothetical protein